MKENIDNAIKWIKEQPIDGCITGSILLDYFENADVDVFVYDEKSFNKILFAMHHNDMFQILDPLEKWKFEKYINDTNGKATWGITTIKFAYNTCIPINIILKKHCYNIFSVLSSFDMDIICKGFDIKSKQMLDLTGDSTTAKIASWNKWNPVFYNPELWEISRVLRQLERVIKYYKRGYNTDNVVLKYIDLINAIQKYQNIFNSDNFSEKLKIKKENTKVVKKICKKWLETHEITDEHLQLLKEKIKEI